MMKRTVIAIVVGAMVTTAALAAPPAAPQPPMRGGVRAAPGFIYRYSQPFVARPAQPWYPDPFAGPTTNWGFQGPRYPLGGGDDVFEPTVKVPARRASTSASGPRRSSHPAWYW